MPPRKIQPSSSPLAALLQANIPPEMGCGYVCDGQDYNSELTCRERSCLSVHASEKRRRQFAAGRAAAHVAIRSLGGTHAGEVLSGPKRFPRWPDGIVGSISHCAEHALAVAALSKNFQTIGVDIQRILNPAQRVLERRICTPPELDWVRQTAGEELRRLSIIFSAKESLFKALNPVTEIFFGFQEAVIEVTQSMAFSARISPRVHASLSKAHTLPIQLIMAPDQPLIVTLCALPAKRQ